MLETWDPEALRIAGHIWTQIKDPTGTPLWVRWSDGHSQLFAPFVVELLGAVSSSSHVVAAAQVLSLSDVKETREEVVLFEEEEG